MAIDTNSTALGPATVNEALQVAKDQYGNVLSAIRRSPLQSMGIAAGIGFVAALLARGFGQSPRAERARGRLNAPDPR